MKLVQWSPEETQEELVKRLANSKDQRRELTHIWQASERAVYNTTGGSTLSSDVSMSLDSDGQFAENFGDSESNIGTNFVFKNLRFIHAQLSANPPSVIPRPTSNDPDDRRRADAADRLVRYAMRQYNMMEKVDSASLNCLVYGSSFVKIMWDNTKGDIVNYEEESGEMVMEGDLSITVPNPWDIYLDPEATNWDDVRFVFERIYLPYEEAVFKFPEAKELLKKYRIQSGDKRRSYNESKSAVDHRYYDSVELYQYWEKGLPTNGFMGRFCVCTKNGEPVTKVTPNPERYKVITKDKGQASISKAVLPFIIFTDIDVPNQIWGKSFVEFASALQDNLNRLDSVLLENIQAHGVARLILPEGTEIADDSITNSPYDIVKITGTQPPHFMQPMGLPGGMDKLRDILKMGVDEVSGVNEAMFGQQSREQSGFSMQYATNQGNMIRRRLFNKYVGLVEGIYRRFLQIVQKHWTTPRTIHVLGKEKAFEAADIKGADIASGYDLVVEYGASLSLDPTTRREEILTLLPLFEKAGVNPKEIMNMLKLNELSGLYDTLELANDRQREIFEEMINLGLYIPPEELQDHANMLTFAYRYVMTTEYKYLPEAAKQLIRQHILDREQIAAASQAQAQAPGGLQPPEMMPPQLPGQGAPMGAEEAPPILPGI